ncbi:MAG: NAD(+)/NADH kinase [Opitutales bacterium]|nr:NAD(+)/NADH kinase [Opitutales bacterium]
MAPIQKITIVVNRSKSGAESLAQRIEKLATDQGKTVTIIGDFPVPTDALNDADLCCVIGGDGTILGIVEAASLNEVPVLGINLGRLGFMVHYSAAEVERIFPDILEGNYRSERRTLIRCRDNDGHECLALNDVVVRSNGSRLVPLELSADGEVVNQYYADGVIFSTPTGSTAYNLSAGGPIVHPKASVLLVTPINPHTLSNRAIVLDGQVEIKVAADTDSGNIRISADGREAFDGEAAFPIELRIDPQHQFELILPRAFSHYNLLRNKLSWAGDAPSRQKNTPNELST